MLTALENLPLPLVPQPIACGAGFAYQQAENSENADATVNLPGRFQIGSESPHC